MTAMVRASAGAEYRARNGGARPSPAVIKFHVPASLRMTGVIPFAARRSYDVSSDGRDMRLLVPDGKIMRFYIGSVDTPAVSPNPRENLRPQPLIDALHWPQGSLVTHASPSAQHKTRTILLNLNVRAQKEATTAEMEFDLERGTVARLTFDDKLGHPLSEVRYSDWRYMTQSNAGDAPFCFPKHIDLMESRQDLILQMEILSLALNPQIAPAEFRLNPPRGIPVTQLATNGAGSKH